MISIKLENRWSKIFYVTISTLIYFSSINSFAVSNEDVRHIAKENPLGGGRGYNSIINKSEATVVVSNKSELLSALKYATYGDVIYVSDNAKIDLSGNWYIQVPEGVTLASGRGKKYSKGALLFTKSLENKSLFVIKRPHARITGLRIRGPIASENIEGCNKYEPNAISVVSTKNISLDNNEIYQWPFAGIVGKNSYFRVDHNHIHHNKRRESNKSCVVSSTTNGSQHGLGYGIMVNKGNIKIYSNYFNNNRHDIAGTGLGNSSYDAFLNLSHSNEASHAFDMHGCQDRVDHPECVGQPYHAGKTVIIHHNYFHNNKNKAVVYRGEAENYVKIYNNRSRHGSRSGAINQNNKYPYLGNLNFIVYGNDFSSKLKMWTADDYDFFGLIKGDFNGDGKGDVIYRGLCGKSSTHCWRFHEWKIDQNYLTPDLGAAKNYGNDFYPSFYTKKTKALVGDFNGDGKDDLAYAGRCGSSGKLCWRVHLVSEGKFNVHKFAWFDQYDYSIDFKFGVKVGDFNGDGLDDLLMKTQCTENGITKSCFKILRSNGISFERKFYGSNPYTSSSTYKNPIIVGDVNRDGKSDIGYFGRCGESGTEKWRYHISRGNSFWVKCSSEKLL